MIAALFLTIGAIGALVAAVLLVRQGIGHGLSERTLWSDNPPKRISMISTQEAFDPLRDRERSAVMRMDTQPISDDLNRRVDELEEAIHGWIAAKDTPPEEIYTGHLLDGWTVSAAEAALRRVVAMPAPKMPADVRAAQIAVIREAARLSGEESHVTGAWGVVHDVLVVPFRELTDEERQIAIGVFATLATDADLTALAELAKEQIERVKKLAKGAPA